MPVRHVFIGDARRHVEHDDGALALDVVAVPKTAEALLARRVPDRQLHRLAAQLHRLHLEVDADRRGEVLLERVVGEAEEDRRLADAGVADEEDLEEVVVILLEAHLFKNLIIS